MVAELLIDKNRMMFITVLSFIPDLIDPMFCRVADLFSSDFEGDAEVRQLNIHTKKRKVPPPPTRN